MHVIDYDALIFLTRANKVSITVYKARGACLNFKSSVGVYGDVTWFNEGMNNSDYVQKTKFKEYELLMIYWNVIWFNEGLNTPHYICP